MTDRRTRSAGHRDRLRQRLLAGGGDAFHDYELLEYLLALAIPRQDTKPLAKRLIDEFGSLAALIAATPEELKRVEGLGDGAAAAIKFVEAVMLRSLRTRALDRPVLSGWQALLDYLHASLAHRPTEQFRVIFLNNRNVMIRDEVMNDGTVNAAPVYPREIGNRALDLGAAAVGLFGSAGLGGLVDRDLLVDQRVMAVFLLAEGFEFFEQGGHGVSRDGV